MRLVWPALAFRNSEVPNLLIIVCDGREVVAYLTGFYPSRITQRNPCPECSLPAGRENEQAQPNGAGG